MSQHVVGRFSSVRNLLAVGVLTLFSVVAVNGSLGQARSPLTATPASAPTPEIEAATIKPVKEPSPNNMHDSTVGRRLTMRYTTLRDLMMMAYEVDPRQIVDGPAWVATDEYDIDLVVPEGVQVNQCEEAVLAELMADRFQLKFHRQQRMMAVYVLEVAKGGPKLKAAGANSVENSQCEHLGVCSFHKRTLANFARFMQFVVLDRPVVDKTGIDGEFDFTLRWTPDESQFNGMKEKIHRAQAGCRIHDLGPGQGLLLQEPLLIFIERVVVIDVIVHHEQEAASPARRVVDKLSRRRPQSHRQWPGLGHTA
jgi:uncharacterized protein (TIGR03435 family)